MIDTLGALKYICKCCGDVVQLVRTLPCHGRGRGFESRRPRHSFECIGSDHQQKILPRYRKTSSRGGSAAVAFVADNPGLISRCHMHVHVDFGFMQLLEYAG